jgi:hypothetical protein
MMLMFEMVEHYLENEGLPVNMVRGGSRELSEPYKAGNGVQVVLWTTP